MGSTAEVTPVPVLRGTEVGVTGTSTGPTELRTLEVVVLTKIGMMLLEVVLTLVPVGAVVRGAAMEVTELVVVLP